MKGKEYKNKIDDLWIYINDDWKTIIQKQPKELLKMATELRIRCKRGCSISCGDKNYPIDGIDVFPDDMNEILKRICGGTVYQFESRIENGYIPLPGGHRAGICGTYSLDQSGAVRINNLSSINFRICRDIKSGSERLLPKLMCEGHFCSTLIVSEPCGGKTTLLTDLVRELSKCGFRTAVIDERGEIASVVQGVPQKDLGVLADVLDGYPKPYGMMVALRTLAPQVLVCDEIGTDEETARMMEAMNAGVPVLATAHAKDEEELLNRPQIKRLIDAGAISKIVLLKGAKTPGKVRKVLTVNRYDDENFWSSADC